MRVLRAEREREWETNAHRDLVRQMRSELKDVKAQIPREKKFVSRMVAPLERLQRETGKLARKESAALKQETFVEKNMENVENQVTRHADRQTVSLGESKAQIEPLVARVKRQALKKLAAEVASVKSSASDAVKTTNQKLNKFRNSEEATKKQL